MVAPESQGVAQSSYQAETADGGNAIGQSDHAISRAARFLFDARRERKIHFDDFSGTDGAFAIMLGLFLERAASCGVSAARTMDFADAPLSTAIYVLGVLVEGGWVRQIGAAGQEHYALSLRAEEAMHRYLAAILDSVGNAPRHFA